METFSDVIDLSTNLRKGSCLSRVPDDAKTVGFRLTHDWTIPGLRTLKTGHSVIGDPKNPVVDSPLQAWIRCWEVSEQSADPTLTPEKDKTFKIPLQILNDKEGWDLLHEDSKELKFVVQGVKAVYTQLRENQMAVFEKGREKYALNYRDYTVYYRTSRGLGDIPIVRERRGAGKKGGSGLYRIHLQTQQFLNLGELLIHLKKSDKAFKSIHLRDCVGGIPLPMPPVATTPQERRFKSLPTERDEVLGINWPPLANLAVLKKKPKAKSVDPMDAEKGKR